MQEHTLTLDDATLPYLLAGRGPLIILSHAIGPVGWGPLNTLNETCTIAIPIWDRCTLDIRSRLEHDWFEPLVRDAGFDSAALCAWSMSGPAAIEFAAEQHPALSRLILVDPAGLGPDLPPLRLRDLPHLLLTQRRGRPTRAFVRIMWRNWVHQPNQGTVVDTKPLIEATYRFFQNEPNARMGPPDEDDESLLDQLASIDIPTLLLTGRHSTVLGPMHAQAAAAKLPNATLIIFENSSHTLQLEEPARFQQALAEFVHDQT